MSYLLMFTLISGSNYFREFVDFNDVQKWPTSEMIIAVGVYTSYTPDIIWSHLNYQVPFIPYIFL